MQQHIQIEPDHEGPYPLVPLPTDPSVLNFTDPHTLSQWLSTDLALTHNVVIRALNTIWLNAPLIQPEDETAFAGYALACVGMIKWHHEMQERILFPLLQLKLMDMRKNMAQHIAVEGRLGEFEKYLIRVRDKVEKLDADRVLEMRRGFGGLLVQHFHDEIDSVSPKYLFRFAKDELDDLAHALEHHRAGLKDSSTLYPFILSAHCKESAAHWPAVPASVKWFASHVGSHIHRGYWKFAPYTIDGEYQTYPPHSHDGLERNNKS